MQERASRQDLVVPPKGVSAASLFIGAILCGLAGFAVVWVAGIGRTVPATTLPVPVVTSGAPMATASPPARLAETTPAELLPASRFSGGTTNYDSGFKPAGEFSDATANRFSNESVTAVTFEKQTDSSTMSADDNEKSNQPPQPLSRFSNRQISPSRNELPLKTPTTKTEGGTKPSTDGSTEADSTDQATIAPGQMKSPTESATQSDDKTASPPSVTGNAVKTDSALSETSTDSQKNNTEAPQANTLDTDETKNVVSSTTAAPTLNTNTPSVESSASEISSSQSATTAMDETSAIPLTHKPVKRNAPVKVVDNGTPAKTRSTTPFVAPAIPVTSPDQSSTLATQTTASDQQEEQKDTADATPKQAAVTPSNSPPQTLAADKAAAPLKAGANPFARPESKDPTQTKTTLQNTGVAMPFAAAPPVGKTPAADATPAPPAQLTPPPATEAAKTTGQGRPGIPQLEGIQTPQLTIEKSGPRDLQVGKPVRFEVTIRNVGAATAYDTLLHDAVPFGTKLITTIPPASPAGPNQPSGTLSWAIGELKPGQEARVAMELMPEQEGEVGSVASVNFRTDATVRSRVTKPALAIVAEPLTPTLIGQPLTVALKLTNPGTGTATGVVVEGLLPEAVSHPAGREVEFDVGRLEPGETKEISLVLQTVIPGVHEVILGARADGDVETTQKLKAEITAPTLELAADIPSRRYLQRPATCTIRMSNTGTAPALAVELAAQLPDGMKFVRANHAGYYDERTNRVLWSLEELPAGEVGTVEVVVMPTTLGPQPLVIATRNPAGLADQLSHTIEVEGLASLSFEVTDSEDPIELGGMTEYVVRVVNEGTKAATNVALVAKLLGDLEPVDAHGPAPFELENLQVEFDPLASLAPADEAVFRIQVRGQKPGNQRVQFLLKSDDQETPLTSEELTHVYADR